MEEKKKGGEASDCQPAREASRGGILMLLSIAARQTISGIAPKRV